MIQRIPLPIALICSVFSLGLALFWVIGSAETVSFLSQTMKFNTALATGLASLSLLFLLREIRPRYLTVLGLITAAITFAIGAATLFQYAFFDLGIDQLVVTDLMRSAPPGIIFFPGRAAPNAAVIFVLFGIAMLCRDYPTREGRFVSDYLLLAVAVISGAAIIGYLFEYDVLFRVSKFVRIARLTAIMFLLLSLAAALSRPSHKSMLLFLDQGPAGILARRLMPAAIVVPVLLCWGTSYLRALELLDRPTAYSSLAIALVVFFALTIWWSVHALAKSEQARLQSFEQEKRTLNTINYVGQNLISQLNLGKLVQSVTDAATGLTGAQFGAFFYHPGNSDQQSFSLYTISGVPREKFSVFENPRSTAIFSPTFNGETVRSDDVTKDPRYGLNEPHQGIPFGHLPVRSYLAVPVVARSGEVMGAIFMGHEQVGVFSEQSERIVVGLAAQTAIAMDNARLYKELQDSVRARDEFLSIASHELRTPLTSLKLQSQMRERLINRGQTERFTIPGILKMVQGDHRQIDRLARLVDDMLDIGRINTGKLTLSLEKFNLVDLAREVGERLSHDFLVAGAELSLPKPAEVWIYADRDRMEQVLVNLLTNALKYGLKKPVQIQVRVEDDKAHLEVADQGIGIAPENQTRIFERFERAVTASEISGLGLGLFIVRQILTLHQGRIWVTSALGKGSTFHVQLPQAGT